MRGEALAIKGVLRFRELVTLDLRSLPLGLIAVVGANGEGKSTFLEAAPAALFRTFPSRGKRELFDYTEDRDAYLEYTFSLDGDGLYRARVTLDGVRRDSEAVLERIDPSGARQILNDGKRGTFDAAVARVLGVSKEVFLASAFAAQNRTGSFLTLDRAKRRELFASLCGLDHLEAMAQTAKTAAGLVDQARLTLVWQRDLWQREASPQAGAALLHRLLALNEQAAAVDADSRGLEERIAALEHDRATWRDEAARHQVATATIQRLLQNRAGVIALEDRATQAKAQAARTLDRERQQIAEALDARLTDLTQRIGANRWLIDQREAIRAAVTQVAVLEAEFSEARAAEVTARQGRDQRYQTASERAQAVRDAERVALELDRVQRDTAILRRVPCEGAGIYAACELLTNAQAASARVPQLQPEVDRLPALRAAHADWEYEAHAAQTLLDDAARRVQQLEASLTTARAGTKHADQLAAAEARIAEHEASQIQAREAAAVATAAADQRAAELIATLEDALGESARGIQALSAEIDAAHDEAGRTKAASDQLTAAEVTLRELRLRRDVSTGLLAQVAEQRATLDRDRQAYRDRLEALHEVQARLTHLERELLDWQFLAKVLGRDGLQTMEIDEAGPTVSSYANDLITAGYGPRFTLDLVTQEPKAGGKGLRETFELKVLDNARGGAMRDVTDLSGGEQVLVDEALKSAISIMVNTKNARPIRTCWRDETLGALDSENAQRYIAMLRRVSEIAGFERIYFVSHNAEASAQADAQLYMHDGKVEIQLPPFTQAA